MDSIYYESLLYDYYSQLLTSRQREILRLHLQEDYSLSEIAQTLGISRQGVSEAIHRGLAILENMEHQLHMAEKFTQLSKSLTRLEDMIRQGADREELLSLVSCVKEELSLPQDQGWPEGTDTDLPDHSGD